MQFVASMVLHKTVASLLFICSTRIAAAAHFQYEAEHLTTENINGTLNERLPKQSRIHGSDIIDYVSTFLFSSIDVTSDHQSEVIYDLEGPDNCKVFPGDVNWPSRWLWTGLDLVTLDGLNQPAPMSHICYANGTGEVDEAACTNLAEHWNTARFMYVLGSALLHKAPTNSRTEATTPLKS
jgi:hypothetical protein